MISTCIRHYIADIALGAMFDNICTNFRVQKPVGHYLGRYWAAFDIDDGDLITFGLCIQDEGSMVVLDNGEAEYIVATNLYNMTLMTKDEFDTLVEKITSGEMEWIEYDEMDDEQLKHWLKNQD